MLHSLRRRASSTSSGAGSSDHGCPDAVRARASRRISRSSTAISMSAAATLLAGVADPRARNATPVRQSPSRSTTRSSCAQSTTKRVQDIVKSRVAVECVGLRCDLAEPVDAVVFDPQDRGALVRRAFGSSLESDAPARRRCVNSVAPPSAPTYGDWYRGRRSPDGGIGRRGGLKSLYSKGCVGSSPTPGTLSHAPSITLDAMAHIATIPFRDDIVALFPGQGSINVRAPVTRGSLAALGPRRSS